MTSRRAIGRLNKHNLALDEARLAMTCYCPECGEECFITDAKSNVPYIFNRVSFTCDSCGDFTITRDTGNKGFALEGTDLAYIPGEEGIDLIEYQRFDESAYPSKREALEAKFKLMQVLQEPLLAEQAFKIFDKLDDDILDCCRQLADMGVAKFKGEVARFLITRNSNHSDTPKLSDEQIKEIDSLVKESDSEGMIDAIIAVYAYESNGFDSGIDITEWVDMLSEKCINETRPIADKVETCLTVCNLFTRMELTEDAHYLTLNVLDLIKSNSAELEDVDDILSEAYMYTKPSLNTLEMTFEIFEFAKRYVDECPQYYIDALADLCAQTETHPELKEQMITHLDEFIDSFKNNRIEDTVKMKAYFCRYILCGKKLDLTRAFNLTFGTIPEGQEMLVLRVIATYFHTFRNDDNKMKRALKKMGLDGLNPDEVINNFDILLNAAN